MNQSIRLFVCSTMLLPVILCGCASYKVTPIAAVETEGWASGTAPAEEGYIIYQPELYFSATMTVEKIKDDKGKEQVKEAVSVTPLYLPNYKKPYRVTTHNFLAKADFAFEFANGWQLTKLSDKSDNSTVVDTLAGQLETILSAAGVLGLTETKRRVILYRPQFDEKTGYFVSFVEVASVEN
jgi:hypothetical protein